MISQTLSMMGAMYEAIGPGIILVAALPVFAVLLLLILRTGIKRVRSSE